MPRTGNSAQVTVPWQLCPYHVPCILATSWDVSKFRPGVGIIPPQVVLVIIRTHT